MRILKFFALVSLGLYLLAQFNPAGAARHVDNWLHHTPSTAQASSGDEAIYHNLCTLSSAYLRLDGTARTVQGKIISTLATKTASQVDDPELLAFLNTIPAAVNGANKAKARSAQALIGRECTAHSPADDK